MDVEAWLRSLGLERYGAAFREHGIDGEALYALTESDLDEVGVTPNDRSRLLSAMRTLQQPTAATELSAPSLAGSARGASRGDGAQRRQLTLMFCDLVGSTALASGLELEDLEEVMRAYRAACRRAVAAHGGFLARFIGDGMLAYFGYPRADEGAAERAVLAGLELVSAVARLQSPAGQPLAARAAVATGMVVVGELEGEGAAAVVGSTPNLAARLQSCAEPGAVVVDGTTRRLLGSLFILRGLGELAVAGFAEPVATWVVERAGTSESRFHAVRATSLTGFVGREQEMELLLARKTMAWSGQGQVVLISGEPGIGKSRLTKLLSEQLTAEPCTRLLYQCSPYHINSTLYPVIEQLRRFARPEPGDPRQPEKLEAMLARAPSQLAPAARLLAALLSPTAAPCSPSQLSPAQQRRRTLATLLDLMEGLASRGPVLLIVEDAHWADATSRELFDLAVERIRRLPILAVLTYRPEFDPPWLGLPNVATLALKPLGPAQVRAMVEQATGGRYLPPEVLDHIIEKTDGVPLFIEEFTNNLLESGLLREVDGRYELGEPLPARALPSTLQDSLLARLDRLGGVVKEAAQVAALVGREFLYAVLEAVSPLPRERLNFAIAGLVQAGLLTQEAPPPSPRYVFKHALIADIAYSTLLRNRRRELHGRVARILEDRFPEIADTQPELVAHHLTEGGFGRDAVDWWEKAGVLALRRGAYPEVTRHFGQAIDLLGSLRPDEDRDRRELALRMRLRLPLLIAKGYGTQEAEPNYVRLEQLAQSLAATGDMLSVLNGRCIVANIRCDFAAAAVHANRLVDLARRHGDPDGVAVGHYHVAAASFARGALLATREAIGNARAHCESERSELCRERYNFEVSPSLASLECLVLQQSGLLDQAASLAVEILADARRNPSAPTRFIVFRNLAFFYMIQRNAAGVEELAAELEKLAQQHDGVEWHTHAELCSAWVGARNSRTEQDVLQAMTKVGAFATRLMAPIYVLQEGELLIEGNRGTEALLRLDLTRSLIEETGQRLFTPEVDRLRGLARRDDPDAAEEVEACFASALQSARQSGLRLWELRAAVSCAQFWREAGRRRAARDLLEPIRGAFTEGAETADLKQARTLLDSLN